MMVLTTAQMMASFAGAEQMGIPHETIVQLQTEGVSDLADFDMTRWGDP